MSSNGFALTVRGLSKAYNITHSSGRHTTLGEAFAHWLKNPLRRSPRETFWSLKNISFDVRSGEILGIIGRNGAGKSTLLKILSSIVEPTAGEILLYGSVGSLLEVGTGFHPELTGRENVYLNGALLGMSRREIKRQFNTIVEFAGVGEFLDTPVKRYSSGMYVRLAFAIAAHLSSDILLLDEVLAVGDIDFRTRCLDKMDEVARSGRTVIFVSHNMVTVQNICDRVIWLSEGRIVADGNPQTVIEAYTETNQQRALEVPADQKLRVV
jgi:lipopolysaccharide transport system ATP-binding protein